MSGQTPSPLRVTSQDETLSTITYTITVTRGAAPAMDTTLRSLSLSPGRLSPAFNPAQSSYDVEVYYEVEVITVAAVKNASDATVAITPPDSDQSTRGHQVALALGADGAERETTITVTVTPQSGTARNYTITVNRLGAQSVEAKLTGLTLEPLGASDVLSPDF